MSSRFRLNSAKERNAETAEEKDAEVWSEFSFVFASPQRTLRSFCRPLTESDSMTQDEQVYRQDRRMAGAGIAAGILSVLLGLVVLWRDGQSPFLITAAIGAMTAFGLARRYRTLTEKIELEKIRS